MFIFFLSVDMRIFYNSIIVDGSSYEGRGGAFQVLSFRDIEKQLSLCLQFIVIKVIIWYYLDRYVLLGLGLRNTDLRRMDLKLYDERYVQSRGSFIENTRRFYLLYSNVLILVYYLKIFKNENNWFFLFVLVLKF